MIGFRRLAMFALLLAASTVSTSADQDETPLDMRVTPVVTRSPATVQATVIVPRDAGNRLLRITIDGDAFQRSSDVTLEGASAPKLHSFRWRSLPAGDYAVYVELYTSDGSRRLLRRTVRVIGIG